MSSSSANSTSAVPWLATSRTTTGRALTCRSTRTRPTAGQLSSRNAAGSSRFVKSVASTIATSDARPDAAQLVHHAGPSGQAARPHVALLSAVVGPDVAALRGWLCYLRPVIKSPPNAPWPVGSTAASSIEWDEILAKDKATHNEIDTAGHAGCCVVRRCL